MVMLIFEGRFGLVKIKLGDAVELNRVHFRPERPKKARNHMINYS